MQGDLDNVTPVGLDQGGGKSTINEKYISLVTIWGNNTTANGEIITSYDACVGVGVIVVGVGGESAPWEPIGGWIVGKERREEWSKQCS